MQGLGNLMFGSGSFAEGAKTITAGKPRSDSNIDISYPSFARTSREQIKWLSVNEPDIEAITTAMTTKTMGVTINIQVESKNSKFNNEAEEYLEEFTNFEFINGEEMSVCELSGAHNFDQSVDIMDRFIQKNGGIIIRHHFSNSWRIPYKFEVVGVDMIDVMKSTPFLIDGEKTETTRNGIVRDKNGKITGLWLYTNELKTKSELVPYSNITYYHEVWINIDQQTAVSKLTSILSRLDMTTQYGVAELEAAIEEAKAGNYIESSVYAELMKVVGDIISAQSTSGNALQRIGTVKDLVTPILKDMSNLGIKAKGLTPIPLGDKIQWNTSKRDSAYKDMNENSEMKIAASQGLSDIGVYSKASDANYSAIKATLETDQMTADKRFNSISKKIFFGIFARAIQVGVQTGRITERVAYWKNPNQFNKFRYLRQNKIDIEPAKNALANKTNIELGLKTKGRIVEEATGQKYEVFKEESYQQDLLDITYEVKLEKARQEMYKKEGIEMPTEAKVQNNTTQAFLENTMKEL